MKINARNLGLSAAITFCSIYTVLGLLLRYYPGNILKFVGTIHMMPKLDYIKSFISVTPRAIVMGMATHMVLAFILFWLIATIYNILEKILKKNQ